MMKLRIYNRIVKRFQIVTLQDFEKQKGKIKWRNIEIDRDTGFKDIKGETIWENDIITEFSLAEDTNPICDFLVIFNDGMGAWTTQAIGERDYQLLSITTLCETIKVTSNIYGL